MEPDDSRHRPIVLQTNGADLESARRGPARYFAWAGTGVIALAAAVGVVAGGTAVWSAFDPGTPGQQPAPLWFSPPATVQPQTATTTPDDHGGRRTTTPTTTRTTEPGDDKGDRTTEPGDDKGGDRTTEPGDDKGGGKDNSGSGSDRSGKN
jgi:hypothetical protein